MNTMTTEQAWMRAVELNKSGIIHAKIGKILAKEGYLSYRTGKPISKAGVSVMLSRAASGHAPSNRQMKKFAGRRTTGRTTKTNEYTVTLPAGYRSVAKKPATTIWHIAELIDSSSVFSPETRKAILDLIVREATGL